MDGDGTKNGFDVQITKLVADEISIPVIASGGAGSMDDFVQVFNETRATGALAASIFHFNEIGIQELKQQLKQQKIEMR